MIKNTVSLKRTENNYNMTPLHNNLEKTILMYSARKYKLVVDRCQAQQSLYEENFLGWWKFFILIVLVVIHI